MGKIYNIKYESQERFNNVAGLWHLYDYLSKQYQKNYVENAHLLRLSIEVSKLSLDNGKIGAGLLQFFQPLDKATLEKVWPKMAIGDEWPGWYGYCDQNFTAAGDVHELSSGALNLTIDGKFLWGARRQVELEFDYT